MELLSGKDQTEMRWLSQSVVDDYTQTHKRE